MRFVGDLFAAGVASLRTLTRPLFDAIPTEFRSGYTLAQTVERLSDDIVGPRNGFIYSLDQATRGTITATDVSLKRSLPGSNRMTTVSFVGTFRVDADGEALLSGKFGLRWYTVAFAIYGGAFATLWTIGATGVALRGGCPFFVPFIAPMGALFVTLSERATCRRNAIWLATAINDALIDPKKAPGYNGPFTKLPPLTR